jgi:hypothetical protein
LTQERSKAPPAKWSDRDIHWVSRLCWSVEMRKASTDQGGWLLGSACSGEVEGRDGVQAIRGRTPASPHQRSIGEAY